MNQALSAVRELVEAIENTYSEEDSLDEEAPGFFVTKIDQVKLIEIDHWKEIHVVEVKQR